jgi:hypothetical protein
MRMLRTIATVLSVAALLGCASSPTAAPLSPMAAEAKAFGDPILSRITHLRPIYTNDFSDPTAGAQKGWNSQTVGSGASCGYLNGEYVISIPAGGGCLGQGHGSVSLQDMVLQADARFLEGGKDNVWYFQFRATSRDDYNISIAPDGMVTISTSIGSWTSLLNQNASAFIPGVEGKVNHLTLITKGSTIAVYINNQPMFLLKDQKARPGWIAAGLCAGSVEASVAFDNLRIWDISDL